LIFIKKFRKKTALNYQKKIRKVLKYRNRQPVDNSRFTDAGTKK